MIYPANFSESVASWFSGQGNAQLEGRYICFIHFGIGKSFLVYLHNTVASNGQYPGTHGSAHQDGIGVEPVAEIHGLFSGVHDPQSGGVFLDGSQDLIDVGIGVRTADNGGRQNDSGISVNSVTKKPGASAFTLIPLPAQSFTNVLIKHATPCLAEA